MRLLRASFPHRHLGLALLAVVATACSSAAAATVIDRPSRAASMPATAAAPVPGSVAIVARLESRAAAGVPDVAGDHLKIAVARLRAAGATVSVVEMSAGAKRVSAQWPQAGSPVASEPVVVWVGHPPTLPTPAPRAARPTRPAKGTAADAGTPDGWTTTVTAPGSGATPGLERFVPPPHPPRTNIRELAPAQGGTTLAGRASWYGPGFDGRQTACGDTFDSSRLTLASRELRCGTIVEVVGPAGTVTATVTDWGPAEWTDRRFDLSRATFDAVASLGSGVTDVTVTVVD